MGVVAISRSSALSSATRHIEVADFYIRELVNRGIVTYRRDAGGRSHQGAFRSEVWGVGCLFHVEAGACPRMGNDGGGPFEAVTYGSFARLGAPVALFQLAMAAICVAWKM